MGIIQKQAIRGTIYLYLGVIVGFITTVLLYPRIFSTAEIGLIRLLVAYSAIFSQFASLGFPRVTTMLFTYFRDYKNKHHGFLFIALMVTLIGLIISLILVFSLKSFILGKGDDKSMLFSDYYYYIIPLIVFSLFFVLFDTYYKVLYNSVQGIFLKEFLQRIFILTASILFLFGYLDFSEFLIIFLVSFFLPTFILLLLLLKDKQFFLKPDFGFLTKDFTKRMINVGIFGILTSFSSILVLNIDSIMINALIDIENTGIYAITFYFGSVILIPSRALRKISSVIIADSWKNDDINTINTIYYKSCLNQVIIASLLFIGIWGNIHNIFNDNLLPKAYESGKYVIFFISLASLFQMGGGMSNMILFTSKHYRVHTYFMILLIILLIVTNLILIPVIGITGAALASAVSFLLFNAIKFIYLRQKFSFTPYDYKTVLVLVVAAAVYGISLLIPHFENYIVDIIIRSVIIAIIYLTVIVLMKLSDEITANFNEIMHKFGINIRI